MSLKYEPASEPFRVPGSETWGVELRGTGEVTLHLDILPRQVDARQPGKGKANSYGARPVHLIVTMMKWTLTSRMSIKNSPPNGLAMKVDVRLLKEGKSDSHGARPVHLIVTMMKWIWTSRLSV